MTSCINTVTTVVDVKQALQRGWEWLADASGEAEAQSSVAPLAGCSHCRARAAVMPCKLPCGHIFCYYCVVLPVAVRRRESGGGLGLGAILIPSFFTGARLELPLCFLPPAV